MQPKYLLAVLLPAIALMAITPAVSANNGAINIKNQSCGLFDGDGNIYPVDGVLDSGHLVLPKSGTGNFRCSADVPNSSGHAVTYDSTNNPFTKNGGDPVTCTLYAGEGGPAPVETLDWHETVSASGQASLVCHIDK